MNRLLTFFMLLVGQPVAWAQSWQELNAELEKYYQAGDYVKSLAMAEKALAQAQREFGEADTVYARALHQLAYVHHTVGNHSIAEKHYRQSLTAWKQLPDANWFEYGITLKCLGQLYGAMNKFPEAEPLLKEAVGYIRRGGGDKSSDYADVLMTLGILYRQMHRLDQAEPVQLEAVRVRKQLSGENDEEYAKFLNELAVLYNWKATEEQSPELLKKSAGLYEQVLAIRRHTLGRTHPRYANTIKGVAVQYAALQQHDRADSLYREAIAIYREKHLDQSTAFASIITDYARLHLQTKNFSLAEQWLEESLAIRRQKQSPLHKEYLGALGVLAEVYNNTGRYQQAEQLWINVINSHQVALEYNFPTLTESERNEFYTVARTYFERFLAFASQPRAASPGGRAQMYNTQLHTKGALLQSTYRMQHVATQLNDSSRALYEAWQTKKGSIAAFYNQSVEQQRKQPAAIQPLEAEAEALEKKLSYQSAPFARSLVKPVDWKQVQQRLGPKEAAIELVRFRKHKNNLIGGFTDTVHYAALIVTPNAEVPRLVLLENGNDLEGIHLRAYQRNLQDHLHDTYAYEQYWQPIARALEGVKRVYLSPDGVFNQVNLQALLNPKTGKYLIEEIDLRLLTSTRDLLLPAAGLRNRSIALFGFPDYNATAPVTTASSPAERYYEKIGIEKGDKFQPLPGTKTEVENISRITRSAGWKTQVFLAGQASEENLKRLSGPGVLHLATHGYFQSDVKGLVSNPLLRTGLLLAGAGDTTRRAVAATEDGILTAYEVTGLALEGTQLVVLSACETGLGEIRNGEGVYGLQRALSAAGAQSVLMSLWKVNDQVTQQLMTLFYRNWLRGLDSREALRQAQAKIRRRAALAHPYYWGSFVITGR